MSTINKQDLLPIANKKMLLNVDLNGQSAIDWSVEHQQAIDELLNEQGALLIRGLNVHGSKKLANVLTHIFGSELLQYNYRSTPRTAFRGNVYTSTEYHCSETIFQHNENAYAGQWPLRIGFYCMLAPETGGETPIADSTKVLEQLPKEIVETFAAKGLKYVRNYSDVDLPWTEVFQTQDKAQVEAFCQQNDISYQWHSDNRLSTAQTNQAIHVHPRTGQSIWFNQAHLFHLSSQPKTIQQDMLNVFGEQWLPRNVYFGDGSAIPTDMLDTIRGVYQSNQIMFTWQQGDLLLLDNMLYSHGRQPFEGNRKILVAMARATHSLSHSQSDSQLLGAAK